MAQKTSSPRKLWAAIAIGVIAVAMVFVVFTSNKPSDNPGAQAPGATENSITSGGAVASPPEVQEPQRIHVERRDPTDPLAVGEVEAPVTLVMYSDFQCAYCALWADQTLPSLLEYVDRGELRIEWRDVVFFGEGSQRAAIAAVAAGLQGAYLEFSQLAFDGAAIPSAAQLSDEGLTQIAMELGLDVDQFTADFLDPATLEIVQANVTEAGNLGVTSTPAFLLNGVPILGAQPADVFLNAVDSELSQNS